MAKFTGFHAGSLIVGGGKAVKGIYHVAASVDFASIAATSTGTRTVTVPGASVGDLVVACPRSDFNDDVILKHAAVTAANTVTLYAYNPTGAAIDPPAVTVDILVFDVT